MSASKTARELMKTVGPMGYVYEGVNGSGHLVFRHTETGVVWRSSSSRARSANQVRQQAARAVALAQTTSAQFVRYVFAAFQVDERSQKIVKFRMAQMTKAFLAEHPDVHVSKGLPYLALKNNASVELLEAARRGGPRDAAISTWKLTGPLFGVTEEKTEDVRTDDRVSVASGEHPAPDLAERDVRETPEADGATGADDAGEPDAERDVPAAGGATPGVALPAELVESLREALSGDLRAERDLLRSALSQALEGLHSATEAIEAALSLSLEDAPAHNRPIWSRTTPSGKVRKPGVLILRRLELMREYRTELPELITAEDLRVFLIKHGDRANLTIHAAGNVLWSLDAMGLGVQRVGRGVYGWSE